MSVMFASSLQVTCVGHIIGAVVADTQLHAQRAAKAVRIEYEELQPIVTIQVREEVLQRLKNKHSETLMKATIKTCF